MNYLVEKYLNANDWLADFLDNNLKTKELNVEILLYFIYESVLRYYTMI